MFPAFGFNNRTMKKNLLPLFLFITKDYIIGVFVFTQTHYRWETQNTIGGKNADIYPEIWSQFMVQGKMPENSSFLLPKPTSDHCVCVANVCLFIGKSVSF